ncbi:ABC transporter permease, partial [Escherichia coli]|nr:ABC transporter permease [Escherichia coli]
MTDLSASLPDNALPPDGPHATSPDATETAVTGRSLFGDAWLRLKANKAAMVSLFYLIAMALVCIAGPWFSPHSFNTIYPDYVRTPPSLEPYPTEASIQTAMDEVLRRMRVDIQDTKVEDGRVFVTVTSSGPIDERNTRYIDRSDTFEDAKVESMSPDKKQAVFSAAVKQQYFFFGTDNVGRDLMTRTLVAGRISLSIGLLAGFVAVTIGVLYGATSG